MVVMPLAIVLSLALGYLAGGDIRGLTNLRLRGEWVLVLLLVCQLSLPLLRLEGPYAQLAYAVWLASYPVMVLICVLNHRVTGMFLAASGLALNGIVIGLNRGMPVSPAAVEAVAAGARFTLQRGDFAHVVLDAATRLPLLADILPVPGPAGVRSVASVGDVLLICGVAGVVVSAMLRHRGARVEDRPLRRAGARIRGPHKHWLARAVPSPVTDASMDRVLPPTMHRDAQPVREVLQGPLVYD